MQIRTRRLDIATLVELGAINRAPAPQRVGTRFIAPEVLCLTLSPTATTEATGDGMQDCDQNTRPNEGNDQ